MSETHKILYRGGLAEIEEKKSRFIAHVEAVSTEKEASDFIAAMKKQYWNARHNCYAFCVDSQSHTICRSSDDGEPSGTAGRPILDVILNSDVHNCVIVVTRYFGGTLLGTGGLVRAYQKAAGDGLAASTILEKKDGFLYTIHTDYSDSGKIQYLTAQDQIAVKDTRYGQDVETDVILSNEQADRFLKKITEATAARAVIDKGDPMSFSYTRGNLIFF